MLLHWLLDPNITTFRRNKFRDQVISQLNDKKPYQCYIEHIAMAQNSSTNLVPRNVLIISVLARSILGFTMINLTTPLWSINWLVQELTTVSIWDFVFFNIHVILWGFHYLRLKKCQGSNMKHSECAEMISPNISFLVVIFMIRILCKKMTLVSLRHGFHTLFQPSFQQSQVSLRFCRWISVGKVDST